VGLAVVSMALGLALVVLGIRAWRGVRSADRGAALRSGGRSGRA
jgi:hypothetical protein